MNGQAFRQTIIIAAACALSACGGGAGNRVVSTPAPTPQPPPSPSPSPSPPGCVNCPVNIFANPNPGQYVTVGASISGPGGNLDTYQQPEKFGAISTTESNQPQIRYTNGGFYEVRMPGADWDRLVHYKGYAPSDPEQANYFQPASVPQNHGYVVTSQARNDGYVYSELASWGSSSSGRWGYLAFGVPTPEGQVPVTGSASFAGKVRGSTDIMQPDFLYGGYFPVSVDGNVSLNFNFVTGTLAGAMTLYLPDGMQPLKLGTFTFKDTVFSIGSTSYSGRFDTNVAGDNFFLGRFTGPNAQETIGAWALPFEFKTSGQTIVADGQTHQALGAWIAKRGP